MTGVKRIDIATSDPVLPHWLNAVSPNRVCLKQRLMLIKLASQHSHTVALHPPLEGQQLSPGGGS